MNIDKLVTEVERIKDHFDAIDKEREQAYQDSRELRRMSVQACRDVQRGRFDNARTLLAQCKTLAEKLINNSARFGFVEEAHQEYSESAFILAFILGEEAPTQAELGTDERGYMLGLADAVGEIRRHILNLLRDDKLDEARDYMDLMDDLQGMLLKFDHTDAVVPLRRKQDMLRGIIERTRGDLTNIICQKKLEACIIKNTTK